MRDERDRPESASGDPPPDSAEDRRESGSPGGGQGRRDEVGASGVYPRDAENVPPDAEVRMAGSWGGGDYEESGGSELVYRDGELLGGLTAGPSGAPTIDIHGGDRPERPEDLEAREAREAREAAARDAEARSRRDEEGR